MWCREQVERWLLPVTGLSATEHSGCLRHSLMAAQHALTASDDTDDDVMAVSRAEP